MKKKKMVCQINRMGFILFTGFFFSFRNAIAAATDRRFMYEYRRQFESGKSLDVDGEGEERVATDRIVKI